jgi:hypothetical protein
MTADKSTLPKVKKDLRCPICASVSTGLGKCPLCEGAGGACLLCGGSGGCATCEGTGRDPGPAVRAARLRAIARTHLRLAAGADAQASAAEGEQAAAASAAVERCPDCEKGAVIREHCPTCEAPIVETCKRCKGSGCLAPRRSTRGRLSEVM